MKRYGATSFQLESNDTLHLSDVLYVPGMKRNIVSILALEDKGYKVAFSDGKLLAWQKNSSMVLALELNQRSTKGSFPGNSRTALDCASGPAQSKRDLLFTYQICSRNIFN